MAITDFSPVDRAGAFEASFPSPRKPRTHQRTSMTSSGDNLKRLLDLYRTMARIRAFEETALEAHKAGDIPGPLHVSIGQEAVAAGRGAPICASAIASRPILAAMATRSERAPSRGA